MFKPLLTALFVLSCASFAAAQSDFNKVEVSGGYSRLRGGEIAFTEFDNVQAPDQVTHEKQSFNGFEASATYNFSRYFGVKFDASGNFASYTTPIPGSNLSKVSGSGSGAFLILVPGTTSDTRHRLYEFLGGLQFKDNAKEGRRLKPFAHALFGAARQSVRFAQVQPILAAAYTNPANQTAFAMAFGGGLDVRVSRRVDIRVIQFDYNPVLQRRQTLLGLDAQIVNPSTSGGTNNGTYRPAIGTYFAKHTQQNFRVGFAIVFH
ncbi:MAG: hypothetical protein JOZ96_17540 [Acidobacteria bacterium]|nr:hypothetical protein [Acidobacteriota bacterium]